MPYSDLVTEIRNRRGNSAALILFRQRNPQIPVGKWNEALLAAHRGAA